MDRGKSERIAPASIASTFHQDGKSTFRANMDLHRMWFLAGAISAMIPYLEEIAIPDHFITNLKEIEKILMEVR